MLSRVSYFVRFGQEVEKIRKEFIRWLIYGETEEAFIIYKNNKGLWQPCLAKSKLFLININELNIFHIHHYYEENYIMDDFRWSFIEEHTIYCIQFSGFLMFCRIVGPV